MIMWIILTRYEIEIGSQVFRLGSVRGFRRVVQEMYHMIRCVHENPIQDQYERRH